MVTDNSIVWDQPCPECGEKTVESDINGQYCNNSDCDWDKRGT